MRKRPQPPHLKRWFDKRTRKIYLQFRKRGHKTVPLRQPIGSDEFWQDYNAALKGTSTIGANLRSTAGSVNASIAAYFSSHAWDTALEQSTRDNRRPVFEQVRVRYGEWPLRQMTEEFLIAYLENLKPGVARNHLKALRPWLQHAKHDITRNIKLPKAKSVKHPSWPPEVMAQFEARHAIGGNARLVFGIARYTGAGRSEIARMGPQHVTQVALPDDGGTIEVITIARQKTGISAHIPMHPALRAILDATAITGLQTFLVNQYGKPYSPHGLSNEFRLWCTQAGIGTKYSLHGLRHAMGDALAEAGASPNEIGAVLGHASAKTSLHYTQEANRALLGRAAMARLFAGPKRSGNAGVSEDDPPQTLGTKKA